MDASALYYTTSGILRTHTGQLPDGLIAQLVEHCSGITEVMDSNPVQAWFFFQALISQLRKLCG